MPGGADHGVRCLLGLAGSQPHQVRVALAGGVHDPFAVVISHELSADDPTQPQPSSRSRAPTGRVAPARAPLAGGAARRLPLSRAGTPGRERAARMGEPDLPIPTSASPAGELRALASATDSLQALERLVERGLCRAAHHVAAEARKNPLRAWRNSIVTSASPSSPSWTSPARSPAWSRTSVSADFSTRSNGVPCTRCSHRIDAHPRRTRSAGSRRARICPCASHHLRKRPILDVLDARHARPPARQVVGIRDHLPQLDCGGGDRAAASRCGHRSAAYDPRVASVAIPR